MPDPERESSGCVLGVALGLLVFAGLVVGIATLPGGAADGEQLLAEWFEIEELPFDLEVAAASQTRGRQIVVLGVPDAPRESPKKPRDEGEESQEKSGEEGDDYGEDFDWSKIPVGPEATPPYEVLVVRFEPKSAKAELEGLFASGDRGDDDDRGIDLKPFGSKGGEAVMDRGRIPWHEYAVLFVHERELEEGGTFVDTLRVNLALDERPFVVFARWRRGDPGSIERLAELIEAFRPSSGP